LTKQNRPVIILETMEEEMSNWKHKFGTKTLEEFVRRFFRDSKIEQSKKTSYFNKKLIFSIGKGKNAEIVLSINNTLGTYVGFKVKIINKETGEIATEWFGFKDYLMEGYESQQANPYPQVIEHCGADWYMDGATPEAINSMTEKIRSYIAFYA